MDRDEEKKNNPFEQDAHNETETEIESTAADAASADHIQEDLSEEKEIEAERILVSKLGIVLQDRISRCLGILATSRVMKINESMNYLSKIKLGIRLGWITGISDEEINRIMIKVQPGNQIIDYKAKSQEQIDTGRANLLRTIFKDVDFVG